MTMKNQNASKGDLTFKNIQGDASGKTKKPKVSLIRQMMEKGKITGTD